MLWCSFPSCWALARAPAVGKRDALQIGFWKEGLCWVAEAAPSVRGAPCVSQPCWHSADVYVQHHFVLIFAWEKEYFLQGRHLSDRRVTSDGRATGWKRAFSKKKGVIWVWRTLIHFEPRCGSSSLWEFSISNQDFIGLMSGRGCRICLNQPPSFHHPISGHSVS